MKEVLAFAERMLREHGEFHPFGGTIERDGGVALVGGWTDEDFPPAADMIRMLAHGFRREAATGDIRAAAFVVNVSTQPPKQSNKVALRRNQGKCGKPWSAGSAPGVTCFPATKSSCPDATMT
jgi:hypothetical protein